MSPSIVEDFQDCTDAADILVEAKPAHEKKVSFINVEIREYARCMGDNPIATRGPPISLDWRYVEVGSFKIDEYEDTKEPRSLIELMVPGVLRERLLREHSDVTREEIKKTVNKMNQIKHQRRMTIAMQEYEQWFIVCESLKRKFKRFSSRRSKESNQLESFTEEATTAKSSVTR